MKQIILPALALMLSFMAACKKDDAKLDDSSTKTTFLTQGTWKLTAVLSDEDGNGTYETDDFQTFLPCYTDNFLMFKTNFQLELNEGATKCDPGDSQTEPGTWRLTDNEANIMINTEKYSLMELNNTTLKWRVDGPANTSSMVTFTKR